MWFFKKKKKKIQATVSEQKHVSTKESNVVSQDKKSVSKPVAVESLKARPYTKAKPNQNVVDKNPKEKSPVKMTPKTTLKKPTGKYEIYPEGDYYKYRLKASNGEILCVSFRYSTEKNARTGIETFMKNVEEGRFEVVTDKSQYSQFYLYNQAGARYIIVGEVYKDIKQAYSAVESVKNFYRTDRIDVLDSIPISERREENIEFDSVDQVDTGKYEIYKENALYYIRLIASNGQVMLKSQGYASKATAKSGLNTIKNAIKAKSFTISRDKQNRYQFNLYSSRGQLILAGETYPVKASGISAAHSVLKFGLKASVVEK